MKYKFNVISICISCVLFGCSLDPLIKTGDICPGAEFILENNNEHCTDASCQFDFVMDNGACPSAYPFCMTGEGDEKTFCHGACNDNDVLCGMACVDPESSAAYCGADADCKKYVSCDPAEQRCVRGKCEDILTFKSLVIRNYALEKWDLDGNGKITTDEAKLVDKINDNAFQDVDDLKTLDDLRLFPNLKTIGTNAFRGCTMIEKVDLPQVSEIGNHAFAGCTGLEFAAFPNVKVIHDHAFEECGKLEEVDMENAESIGVYAFNQCAQLNFLYFPKVTYLGDRALNGCAKVEGADFRALPAIPDHAFSGLSTLHYGNFTKADTVGASAFSNCDNLKYLMLPNAVTIGSSAFSSCDALETLLLPRAKDIGGRFVSGSGKLRTLELAGDDPVVDAYTFYNGRVKGTFTDVDLIFNAPKPAEDRTNIEWQGMAWNSISYLNHCMHFSDEKIYAFMTNLHDPDHDRCITQAEADAVTSVSMGDEHELMSLNDLAQLTNWEKIDIDSFVFCDHLRSAELPNIQSIGNDAFSSAKSLRYTDFPNVKKLESAFLGCESLKDASWMENITEIGVSEFRNCKALNHPKFLNLKEVPDRAFSNCDNLTQIELPAAVKLGGNIFENSRYLSAIDLTSPERISVDENTFITNDTQNITLSLHKNNKPDVVDEWSGVRWKKIEIIE